MKKNQAIAFEQPTYAKWKKTHERYAQKSPPQYQAKTDTRKSYHWVVLTYLEYNAQLIGADQPTWFMGKCGRPTASGRILSSWLSHGKTCFLVEGRNRKYKDTYLVVFSKDGKFITSYSKSRDDIPDKLYPISRRRANNLLKLSSAVGDSNTRRITAEAILQCVNSKKAQRIERGLMRYKKHVIPSGVDCGVIEQTGDAYYFTMNCKDTEAKIHYLNPLGWEEFAWATRYSTSRSKSTETDSLGEPNLKG